MSDPTVSSASQSASVFVDQTGASVGVLPEGDVSEPWDDSFAEDPSFVFPRYVAFDLELSETSGVCVDMGAIDSSGKRFHGTVSADFRAFLKDAVAIGGHNVVGFDLCRAAYLFDDVHVPVFDTLLLSSVLFPYRRKHSLQKLPKRRAGERSNPLFDAERSAGLLPKLVSAWYALEIQERRILADLLGDVPGFAGFFRILGIQPMTGRNVTAAIRTVFGGKLCTSAPIDEYVAKQRMALGCVLCIIAVAERIGTSFPTLPAWLKNRCPEIDSMVVALRSTVCKASNCVYCRRHTDVVAGLKEFFGFPSFRVYEGDTESLQEKAALAAVQGESLLAIFPTGGGKSITFQLPALMAGRDAGGLTVVISPLQSLMKDQVDNLESKDIHAAVTINGLINPLERKAAFQEIEDGHASLLYISPEALRSSSIRRILDTRRIERFVIDEAHCFSAWGHDFRVDYLYIGEFLKVWSQKTGRTIPVSCFTATAKAKVVQDICDYFERKLGVRLSLFRTQAVRRNLFYRVELIENADKKYARIRQLLERSTCPAIIYTNRHKSTEELAERLRTDGFQALPYHGGMEPSEKIENQEKFLKDEVRIMVATNAFGMGVDKKDVGLVIHHDISSSLENYVQESGRAGRDERIKADCYILFSEDDLDRHFSLLASTKLSMADVQQVWQAVKRLTRFNRETAISSLEIAREAGWDRDNDLIHTGITAAIAALEEAGYLRRKNNAVKVFATDLPKRTYGEGLQAIEKDWALGEKVSIFDSIEEKVTAGRVLNSLFSRRYTASESNNGKPVAQVDYVADRLGLKTDDVIAAVTKLRTLGILSDDEDMRAVLALTVPGMKKRLKKIAELERALVEHAAAANLPDHHPTGVVHLHAVNAAIEDARGGESVGIPEIKRILLNMHYYGLLDCRKTNASDYFEIRLRVSEEKALEAIEKQEERASRTFEWFGALPAQAFGDGGKSSLVNFSLVKLVKALNDTSTLFDKKMSHRDVEKLLYFLHRAGILTIDGGFVVQYLPMRIERLVLDNRRRYLKKDYAFLDDHYREKIRQIHIVGEYAKLMLNDIETAQTYVRDYFDLPVEEFVEKYFAGRRRIEIERNMSPKLYQKLVGSLSEAQEEILLSDAQHIVVAAGPGSGKTRVLVQKLAHLMLDENVRAEQLLMLTFSRAAATEFKSRLFDLYGPGARFVTIRTFHSYAFDLLGRPGTIDASEHVVQKAVEAIRNDRVEPAKITATALVLDEAQDMDGEEFALVEALMERNDGMRVLAVGDDDQNIYEFRDADSAHFASLKSRYDAEWFELVDNWRSLPAIVETANRFAESIRDRMKSKPIRSVREGTGEVKVVQYSAGSLESAVAEQVIADRRKGRTAVLVRTNDEASRIYGLLQKAGVPSQLVRNEQKMRLGDLLEMRTYTKVLFNDETKASFDDEDWARADRALKRFHERSRWYPLIKTYIRKFRKIAAGNVFASDWEDQKREARFEDLFDPEKGTVFVSTYHGAKGREFEHVHCLLSQAKNLSEENKRAIYVALTRAKDSLVVHTTGDFLPGFAVDGLVRVEDGKDRPPPETLLVPLGYSDVYLSFADPKTETYIRQMLRPGDALEVKPFRKWPVGFWSGGWCVSVPSKAFSAKLAGIYAKGYVIERGEVQFVVIRTDMETRELHTVLLPTLTLRRLPRR